MKSWPILQKITPIWVSVLKTYQCRFTPKLKIHFNIFVWLIKCFSKPVVSMTMEKIDRRERLGFHPSHFRWGLSSSTTHTIVTEDQASPDSFVHTDRLMPKSPLYHGTGQKCGLKVQTIHSLVYVQDKSTFSGQHMDWSILSLGKQLIQSTAIHAFKSTLRYVRLRSDGFRDMF